MQTATRPRVFRRDAHGEGISKRLQGRILLTLGLWGLFGDQPLRSVRRLDWSRRHSLAEARRAGTRVGSLVGEDGDAPERPLAIGQGPGTSGYSPKESQGRRGRACGRA